MSLDLTYPAVLKTIGNHVMGERTESRAFLHGSFNIFIDLTKSKSTIASATVKTIKELMESMSTINWIMWTFSRRPLHRDQKHYGTLI